MKLKMWRKKKGLSQEELAKLLKSDQSNVSNLENGKIRPSLPTIEMISRITKGEVEYHDWVRGSPDWAKGARK